MNSKVLNQLILKLLLIESVFVLAVCVFAAGSAILSMTHLLNPNTVRSLRPVYESVIMGVSPFLFLVNIILSPISILRILRNSSLEFKLGEWIGHFLNIMIVGSMSWVALIAGMSLGFGHFMGGID